MFWLRAQLVSSLSLELLETESVPAKQYQKLSNSLNRVHECDR